MSSHLLLEYHTPSGNGWIRTSTIRTFSATISFPGSLNRHRCAADRPPELGPPPSTEDSVRRVSKRRPTGRHRSSWVAALQSAYKFECQTASYHSLARPSAGSWRSITFFAGRRLWIAIYSFRWGSAQAARGFTCGRTGLCVLADRSWTPSSAPLGQGASPQTPTDHELMGSRGCAWQDLCGWNGVD